MGILMTNCPVTFTRFGFKAVNIQYTDSTASVANDFLVAQCAREVRNRRALQAECRCDDVLREIKIVRRVEIARAEKKVSQAHGRRVFRVTSGKLLRLNLQETIAPRYHIPQVTMTLFEREEIVDWHRAQLTALPGDPGDEVVRIIGGAHDQLSSRVSDVDGLAVNRYDGRSDPGQQEYRSLHGGACFSEDLTGCKWSGTHTRALSRRRYPLNDVERALH
jgi:hypothetical protein